MGIWNRDLESWQGPIKLVFFRRVRDGLEKEAVRDAKALGRLVAGREIGVELLA